MKQATITKTFMTGLATVLPIAVYLPLNYQVGGITVVLPRSHVQQASISTEEAWRFVLTAGVAGHAETVSGFNRLKQ